MQLSKVWNIALRAVEVGMARSRNLKPAFFTNEELAKLPEGARLLFEGLWVIADREGRLKDSAEWIKAQVFPYEKKPVEKWLSLLSQSGFIVRYENEGRRYIQVLTFLKHQRPHINEPESTIPAPTNEQCQGQCSIGPESVPSTYIDRGIQHSGIKEEGISNQQSANRFSPPTVEQVAAYCESRKNDIDPALFVDFYAAKGWKVGNQPMKDWQAAVRTWERNKRSTGAKSDDPRGNLETLKRYLERPNGDDDRTE